MPTYRDPATTEDVLWGWLKRPAKAVFRYDLHMTRIENAIAGGTPDVEGTLLGSSFWIELKCSYRPVREDTTIKVRYRPKQPPWHRRRARSGGRVFTLLQVGSGRLTARRYLLEARHLPLVKEGVTEDVLRHLALVDPRSDAETIIRAAAGRGR